MAVSNETIKYDHLNVFAKTSTEDIQNHSLFAEK